MNLLGFNFSDALYTLFLYPFAGVFFAAVIWVVRFIVTNWVERRSG